MIAVAQNHEYFWQIKCYELNINGQLKILVHCLRVHSSFREMVSELAMHALQLVPNVLDLCHQPKLEQAHVTSHTHTPTWPHVSLPRRYPVKLQASAHPSKQRFGHSTVDFGQAILPGMWDDVRLGTNLKACRRDPTCRFSNLCMDVGPGLLDLRVPLQDQKNS